MFVCPCSVRSSALIPEWPPSSLIPHPLSLHPSLRTTPPQLCWGTCTLCLVLVSATPSPFPHARSPGCSSPNPKRCHSSSRVARCGESLANLEPLVNSVNCDKLCFRFRMSFFPAEYQERTERTERTLRRGAAPLYLFLFCVETLRPFEGWNPLGPLPRLRSSGPSLLPRDLRPCPASLPLSLSLAASPPRCFAASSRPPTRVPLIPRV